MAACAASLVLLPAPAYLLRSHGAGEGQGTPYGWACIAIAINGWQQFLAADVSAEPLPPQSYLLRSGRWTCILIDIDGGRTAEIEGMGGIAPTLAEARAAKAAVKAAGFTAAKWRRRKGSNSHEVTVGDVS